MGSKESKFLNEAVKDLEKDRQIDAADMKKVFDSFDNNKSGFLEGKEVEKFIGFLFDYVFAKNNPAEVTQAWGTPGYAPHTPGVPTNYGAPGTPVTVVHQKRASSAERSQFNLEVRQLLDVDKDGRLSWQEFITGLTSVLKDRVLHVK